MSTATKHPLDFETLAKGTWIEALDLERALLCQLGGRSVGLGDFRPRFGRFEVQAA